MIQYGNMRISVEDVTPAQAAAWLERNVCNRRLRPGVVAQYSRDMLRVVWFYKPTAICFDEDGNLGNGQHTLGAIVQSGTTQRLLIARNVPKDSIAAMDRGVARSIADIAHFLGLDTNRREIAIARIVQFGEAAGSSVAKRSFDELFDAFMSHETPIRWVVSLAPRVKFMAAPMLAVIVRAWYTQDRDRLAEFINVMSTGISNGPEDGAAIRLREVIRSARSFSTNSGKAELYRKTQTALERFLARADASKLYGTEKELFPVPTTMRAAKAA
jgi:hypothetical protein